MGDAVPTSKKRHSSLTFSSCLLWPNGWMDQDAIWYAGTLDRGNIVLDGDPAPNPLPPKRAQPPISTHVCCGQTAGWIKMPLGREVGFPYKPHCVRWGPSFPRGKGHSSSTLFGPCLFQKETGIPKVIKRLYCKTRSLHESNYLRYRTVSSYYDNNMLL